MRDLLVSYGLEVVLNREDFNKRVRFFLSEDPVQQSTRMDLYKVLKETLKLSSLAEAKLHLLQVVFGAYLESTLEKAQKMCISSPKEALELVKDFNQLGEVFKSAYDSVDLKGFCASVVDITHHELEAIFSNEEVSVHNLKVWQKSVKEMFKTNFTPIEVEKEVMGRVLSHPLFSLLSISREDRFSISALEGGKYETLAKTLLEFKQNHHQEKMDGLIFYLIKLDLEEGFINLDSKTPEKALLEQVCNGRLSAESRIEALTTLADISQQQSIGFARNRNGSVSEIETKVNHGRSSVSIVDRHYDLNVLGKKVHLNVHTANRMGENQNNQVPRGLSALKKDGSAAFAFQISKESPFRKKTQVGRVQNFFDTPIEFSPSEQVVLGNMVLFSGLLKNGLKENVITGVNQYACIFTDFFEESIKISTALQKPKEAVDTVKMYGFSLLSIFDKYDLLYSSRMAGNDISTQNYEFFIIPFVNLTYDVMQLAEKEGNGVLKELSEQLNYRFMSVAQHWLDNGMSETVLAPMMDLMQSKIARKHAAAVPLAFRDYREVPSELLFTSPKKEMKNEVLSLKEKASKMIRSLKCDALLEEKYLHYVETLCAEDPLKRKLEVTTAPINELYHLYWNKMGSPTVLHRREKVVSILEELQKNVPGAFIEVKTPFEKCAPQIKKMMQEFGFEGQYNARFIKKGNKR